MTPFDRTVIPAEEITQAITSGLSDLRQMMERTPQHEITTSMLGIISTRFAGQSISDTGLYPAGVALLYFCALAEIEMDLKRRDIPPLMGRLFSDVVLSSLKRLHGVSTCIEETYSAMEMEKVS